MATFANLISNNLYQSGRDSKVHFAHCSHRSLRAGAIRGTKGLTRDEVFAKYGSRLCRYCFAEFNATVEAAPVVETVETVEETPAVETAPVLIFTADNAPENTTATKLTETLTLHESTWTYGDYTLLARYSVKADGDASTISWSVSARDWELPSIHDNAPYRSTSVNFGVNWSAQGTKTPEEARTYARHLLVAADAADHFNEIISSLVA